MYGWCLTLMEDFSVCPPCSLTDIGADLKKPNVSLQSMDQPRLCSPRKDENWRNVGRRECREGGKEGGGRRGGGREEGRGERGREEGEEKGRGREGREWKRGGEERRGRGKEGDGEVRGREGEGERKGGKEGGRTIDLKKNIYRTFSLVPQFAVSRLSCTAT